MCTTRGLTLIEVMVVISIIGFLTTAAIGAISDARQEAKVTAAQTQLKNIRQAMVQLELDTGYTSGRYRRLNCTPPDNSQASANGVYVSDPRAGLSANDGRYPNWSGPYIGATRDPWGQEYILESHYRCLPSEIAAQNGDCRADGTWYAAIISGGPNNSGFNQYDADNIAYIICEHAP